MTSSYRSALTRIAKSGVFVGSFLMISSFTSPVYHFSIASAYAAETNRIVDFKRGDWPGILQATEGLSAPEAWGTWSDSKSVRFVFSEPLPERFSISIQGIAIGPNVDSDVKIRAGKVEKTFKLIETPTTQKLEFSVPAETTSLEFDIPEPISPKELKMNDDERRLGIGFISLEIEELSE